jgi:PAS domain S-box-containing protein
LQNICFRIISKSRQKTLRQSEQRFQTLLATASDAFFLHDMHGKLHDVNEQACRNLGYTRQELLKLSVGDIEVGADQQMLVKLWPHLQKVTQLQAECTHRRKDGTTFPVEVRFGLVEVDNEKLVSVLVRDVTERKEAEKLVRQSQQRMALHIQNTPLGVIECDENALVTEWNCAAESIFGYCREEVIGKEVAGLIIPQDVLAQVKQTWEKVVTSKDGISSTNDNMTKSGEIITCEWYNTPLIDENGSVFGMASLVQDITAQLQSQRQLAESEASYRTLFEMSDEAMMTLDGEGFIDCNKATLRLFVYESTEAFMA